MKKNVLVFGLISGVVISAMMVYAASICCANPEMKGNDVLGYAGMVAAFSFIFVGIRNHREKYNGGFITFGGAFKIGFYISLIASTIYVLAGWWTVKSLFPEFLDSYIQHVLYVERLDGATAAELQQKTAEMADFKENYKNPLFFLLVTYAEVLPLALIITLISALLLKRKPKAGNVVAG
ncbi:DUF4199 family protein [Fulvivirgaceae bacterium PWU4]|uniref:DUF4199 family protein n=1 Tax=Chryseosolibacter histidini TaxID=2782349 RepID=A0AAP2GSH5_9BACT|nr:DUF4199 domain-containing protein [Chryseosolibacter histidini]MBT1701155.1 DUF4199 family protein [Chryseosolibacter histidini]